MKREYTWEAIYITFPHKTAANKMWDNFKNKND